MMPKSDGLLSLICATRGRYQELERLIASLGQQTSLNFELIIVDQNPDDLLLPLLDRPRAFPIHHIKLTTSGNTHARNVGLRTARGEWLAFPDDDCWYPATFIEEMCNNIQDHPDADGFFINWSDPAARKTMFEFSEGDMTINDAFTLASCICLFLRREKVMLVSGFNERLGIGDTTIIKAGEEQDLVLRMLSRSMRLVKLPNLFVHHEIGTKKWDNAFLERIKGQGACDYFFTKKYIGSLAALKLATTWLMRFVFNILRGNRQFASWYYHKLKGIRLSSRIE